MIPLLLTIAALATPHADQINRHWAEYAHSSPTVRYLSLEAVPEKMRVDWHRSLLFNVASASRATVLYEHLPRRLDGTMSYYVDLDRLLWGADDLLKVLETYPYSYDHNPLVIRGDWLVAQLADPRNSQAIYLLLYGEKNIPKTDSDFLKFWGADENDKGLFRFGWVETDSQVNLQRTRFVERFSGRDGRSVWRTLDSLFVENGKDPLEALDGNFEHDGRELIAQFTKVSGKPTKRVLGAAQAYLLANGEGARAEAAPVGLVEDYHKTLGVAEIVNHSSCISCHDAGMKFATENGLEAYVVSGVELKVYDLRKKEEIEAFHFTDAGKQLRRDNEDYAAFVEACNGLTTQENSETYRRVLKQYLADLTLEDAARELYCPPEDLRFALGYAADNGLPIGSRLSGLAHGRTIQRTQWEDDYLRAAGMVKVWQAGKPTPALMARALDRDRRAPATIAADKVRFTMIVTCPADAVIYLGNRKMDHTGERRELVAMVKPDWRATVTVTAVLGERRESKTVECVAGQTVEVAMNFQDAGVKS